MATGVRCSNAASSAADRGGAIRVLGPCTGVDVRHCTIFENEAPLGSALYAYSSALPLFAEFTNSVLAFGLGGEAVTIEGSACDISLDPLFCGDAFPEQPLSLNAGSPCAADNNAECGQIGAFGVECWFTLVHETSWGAIKALYGNPAG